MKPNTNNTQQRVRKMTTITSPIQLASAIESGAEPVPQGILSQSAMDEVSITMLMFAYLVY